MIYVGSHARDIATYKGPPWPPTVEAIPATDDDVARFLALYPDATCSPKVLRLLAALHRDFSGHDH